MDVHDRVPEEAGAALRRRHVPALDGIRALAIAVVVAYHGCTFFFPGVPIPRDLGVSLFFVLSGFLITRMLLDEHERTGTVSLRAFYLRRSLRIFPAYYVFLAVWLTAAALLHRPATAGQVAAAFGYVMNYYEAANGHRSSAVSHAWSLALEEQFYLLWPALFLYAAARGRRALAWTLAVAIVAVCAWRTLLFDGLHVGEAYAYDAFDTRFDTLATGCLLAVLCRSRRFLAACAAAGRQAWMPLATLGALLASRMLTPAGYHLGPGLTVDGLLLALFVVQSVQLSPRWGWRWLTHPAVRYVGRISYPLYLYHGFALVAAVRLHALGRAGGLAAGIALALAMASTSYYVVEMPFLRLRERLSRGAEGAPAAVGALLAAAS